MSETKDETGAARTSTWQMEVGVSPDRNETKDSRSQQVAWGIVMMAAGVLFLCAQLDVIDLPSVWNWWPAVFYAIAIPRFFSPRGWPEGITLVLLGSWFFAVHEDWQGLTYANSWPILLVGFGLEIVLKSMIERGAARPQEGPHA